MCARSPRRFKETGLRLDIVVTSDDADQIGGLDQFPKSTVYVPEKAELSGLKSSLRRRIVRVGHGDSIDLGNDADGRPVSLVVHALPGHNASCITLLDATSRVLFSGDALGTQGVDGLVLGTSRENFVAALSVWRAATDGQYDTLYTAHNHQWFTRPAYVDSVAAALTAPPSTPTPPKPGYTSYTAGITDVLAWVHVPA